MTRIINHQLEFKCKRIKPLSSFGYCKNYDCVFNNDSEQDENQCNLKKNGFKPTKAHTKFTLIIEGA